MAGTHKPLNKFESELLKWEASSRKFKNSAVELIFERKMIKKIDKKRNLVRSYYITRSFQKVWSGKSGLYKIVDKGEAKSGRVQSIQENHNEKQD